MNKTIWKFELSVTDVQQVSMPRGAKILSVADQRGVLCMWAEVATDEPKEPRSIRIYGTGHPMDNGDRETFIGTAQAGPFVWHVYERIHQ